MASDSGRGGGDKRSSSNQLSWWDSARSMVHGKFDATLVGGAYNTDRGLLAPVVALSGNALLIWPEVFCTICVSITCPHSGKLPSTSDTPFVGIQYNKPRRQSIHHIASARAFSDSIVPTVTFLDPIHWMALKYGAVWCRVRASFFCRCCVYSLTTYFLPSVSSFAVFEWSCAGRPAPLSWCFSPLSITRHVG